MAHYLITIVVGIALLSLQASCTVHSPPSSNQNDEAIRIFINVDIALQKPDKYMPIEVIFCNATDDNIEVRGIYVMISGSTLERESGTWRKLGAPIKELGAPRYRRDQCQLKPHQWKLLTYNAYVYGDFEQLDAHVIFEWRKTSDLTWNEAQKSITFGNINYGFPVETNVESKSDNKNSATQEGGK